jgi:hypothetical protein
MCAEKYEGEPAMRADRQGRGSVRNVQVTAGDVTLPSNHTIPREAVGIASIRL